MAVKLAGPLETGRAVRNIFDGTLDPGSSPWNQNADPAPTISADGRSATFIKTLSTSRPWLERNVAATIGDVFALRFTVSDKSGTFNRENVRIKTNIAAQLEIDNVAEGERAILFTCNNTGNINVSIGVGMDGTDTAIAGSEWTVSNVQVDLLPSGQTAPSELINVDKDNRDSAGFAEDVLSTVDDPSSGALFTEAYGPIFSFVTDFGVGFITDSFGDESDEFVKLFGDDNPLKFANAISVGGARLNATTIADIDTVITQGLDYNPLAVQAGTLAIERIVNDIIQNLSASASLAHMQTLTDYAESIGLGVIVFTCPPFGNNVDWTQDREDQALLFNSGLVTQYSGNDNVLVYDMFTTLEDPGTFNLAAGLDSGDGLHPNGTGSQDIADDFETVRATLREGVVTTLIASSGAGPFLTGPLTGNLTG